MDIILITKLLYIVIVAILGSYFALDFKILFFPD